MQVVFKVFIAFSISVSIGGITSRALAADNKSGPVDITTICYNALMVCMDACDKAKLTGTEYNNCNRGCNSANTACLGGQARKNRATKDLVRPPGQRGANSVLQ